MATATRSTRNVTKAIIVAEETFTLELSRDEATFLHAVLGCVGGDPETTARRHQGPISDALYKAGINGWSVPGKTGSIRFVE